MKNFVVTVALTLMIAVGLCFPVNGAVTTPIAGVVQMSATGDVVNAQIPYAAKIKAVKVNPVAGGKYYQLRVGSISGAVVYRTASAATTGTMVMELPGFVKPSAGLYFQTDDVGSSILLYTE